MSEHSKAQFKIPPDTGPEPTPTWLSYGQWTPPKKRQAPRAMKLVVLSVGILAMGYMLNKNRVEPPQRDMEPASKANGSK